MDWGTILIMTGLYVILGGGFLLSLWKLLHQDKDD